MTADFEIVGDIHDVERMAAGRSIRGRGARLTLLSEHRRFDGSAEGHGVRRAELHWYEAHGVGRKEFKIKRFLD